MVALLIPNTIWAADPDLENDYTLVKSVTWGDGTNIAGSGACAYTAYDTGNKKQQALTILTAPEDAAGWVAMQAWTDGSGKGWWNRADKGLYCVSAGRSACIFGDDLTTGWLVIFECSQAASNVMSLTNASGEPDGTFSYATSEDGKKFICTITAAENAYVGFFGNKNAGFINKISVYKPNKAVVATTYSVKYVDMEGNTLKENASYDAVAGATIALSDADKANITVGETTYVYDSDDSAEATVAEGGTTVVTVKFHAAANFSYTVNEVCGETNARVTNGTSYETANIKLGYRKYNAVDGQLYKKDATSKEYNYSFKLTQDNQVENIAYAAVEGTNNVVFCAEGEDIEGLTPITEGNTAIRSSNSASAFAPADTKITTLAPGKYKIHAAIYDCATSPNSDWTFMVGAIQAASFNCTTVNIQEFDSQEFAIGRETDLVMLKAGSSSRGLDAIYILKTGDVTPDEAADLNAAADSIAAIVAAKADFQADITAAKAIDTIGKNGAAELAAAITAAETALAAAEATVESIAAAKAALAEAVTAFKVANIDIATAIVNADFSSMEGWTPVVSGSFRDFGNGLIGTYRVRTDDFIPAATVDETHLATEYCIGLEARWDGNFASYNQDVMLPAGNYKLTFDVENVNAGTTSAKYNNLFKVTNGETVYVDESTEWMNGKSGWTSHAIRFILTENATVNISLGYGTGSNNFGHANTPALYVSHLALGTFDPLVDFKEIALKEVDALPTGDALFLYPVDAVNTAKAAIETAATVDDINAAVATAKAAQNKPAADKAYAIANATATGNLCITEGKVSVAKDAKVFFTAVEGGYVLSNEAGDYIFKTDNDWTLSTTKEIASAYVVTIVPVEGGYTIKGATGLFGLDSTDEGSTVYANKAQDKNGLWTIAEYVAPVVEPIYIETDLTAQFNSLATTKWTGSSGQVGWAAPTVTTNSGLNVAAWEKYDGSCDWTGDIMSSSVTGLTPGVYKIELYGAAAFTFGRGFGSTAFTGDFSKDTSETYHENDAITENTGVTLFAETAEGKVSKEIPIWYATNFNTSGIATATLENVIVGDAGTIKIGLSKTSTSTNWHVVQLKGVTAQVDAVELHATTLAAAQAALNAEENAIVTGDERDSLTAAITANTTVAEQTADAYKAAIAALNNAISAFTGAKAAYQSLIDAKAYLVDLPYADAAKKPVVEAATSATDATAKAEALMVALRAYYESNAMAEGVEGAQILTDSIKNPNAQDGINFWTIVKGEGSGGNIDIKNNEPWTDAAGVAEHNYFDGGDWGAQAWDVALEQKIALPAGKFLLTTIARAEKAVDFTLYAGTDSVKIPAISSVGGLFNRGWNNASVEFEMAEADSIVIGVRGVTAEIHNWMSFANFRLVQLEKPVVVEPIEGISYSWESPAGEPIQWGGTIAYVNGDGDRLNYLNSGYYTICLNGKKANLTDTVASANAGKMVITLDKAVAEGDTIAITGYITKKSSSKSSAYIVYENGTNIESEVFGDESNIYAGEDSELATTGAINTKYVVVSAEAAGSKTITMTRGQTGTNLFITKLQIIEKKSEPVPTGISTVKNCDLNGTIYNMNGQKVNKAQKGLFIINGKKTVIK